MKNRLLSLLAAAFVCASATAGGLMTNTNYHIAFARMMARGASFDIDAIYSNPAGMVWGHEGWQFSFNWQMPTQNRDITATFPLFPEGSRKFKGEASAPFVPALFASYKHDRWAISAMIGITGSGGYVKYNDGIPMLTAPIMGLMAAQGMKPTDYTIDSNMKGKQYVFGAQVNFAYRLTDHLSVAAGLRASYYDGYYKGHLNTTINANSFELLNFRLDCLQKGWGFSPVVGLNYHNGRLTVAAKYDFRTKLNIPNDTRVLSADIHAPGTSADMMAPLMAPYADGAKTRYDMPAMLGVAVGYEFTPKLRATVEYHFFDDKNAKMANNRQEHLKRGTNEYLVGVEYDINKTFTVSAGGQRTDYGLQEAFQTNTSFACDSYSIGFGGAANLSKRVRLTLGYFWSIYDDFTCQTNNYCNTTLPGTDVYSRTNRVLGIGIDYKF